jgi:hypothetical protein
MRVGVFDPAHHLRRVLKPAATRSPLDDREGFRSALRAWFDKNGKDYPWRRSRDPYAVLVSEVMLQQTQIATVLGRGFYTRFLERFPDVETLAAAEDDVLLKAWEGLGYYRRARMLRESAKAVIARHGGDFPADPAALLASAALLLPINSWPRPHPSGIPAEINQHNCLQCKLLCAIIASLNPV